MEYTSVSLMPGVPLPSRLIPSLITRVTHPTTWTRSNRAETYSITTGKKMSLYPTRMKQIPRISTCRYHGHISGPMKKSFRIYGPLIPEKWRGREDSNPRPQVPKTRALSTELRPQPQEWGSAGYKNVTQKPRPLNKREQNHWL